MGATSSRGLRQQPISQEIEGTAVEPGWPLPPACQDDIWVKVDLSMLVGTGTCLAGDGGDFAHALGERRRDGAVGENQASNSLQLDPISEGYGDQEDDWLAASLCLSMPFLEPDEMEVFVARVKKKMMKNLSCLCYQEDVFCGVVSQRLHVLQCVHAAMSRQRCAQSQFTSGNPAELSRGDEVAQEKEASSEKGTDCSGAASGDDLLGLQLFFSLLEFARNPECGQEQLADFLEQIAPVLASLPPLCLADRCSGSLNNQHARKYSRTIARGAGVVNSLRGFLATLALSGKGGNAFPHAEGEPGYCSGQPRGTSEQREIALSAMVGLVAARSRASDLLVLVKVLLSTSTPRQELVDVKNDEDKINPLPGTTGLREGHVVTECSAKRRPISRVKARTSRQGLPVDDEDDFDEDGSKSVLIAHSTISTTIGAEPTLSGTTAGGPWKNKTLSRPHHPGEKDVDSATQLEIHSAKGRKVKGEGVKFRSSMDLEPWTKVEPTSNQQSVQELPYIDTSTDGIKAVCILPFLRRLHAATPNVDPYFRECSPVSKREVWTCGQNSYGELGHSDTGTRKVHCLVKSFEGREVVDVAAGNEHSILLCRTGEVYAAGYNDNGQCGQGTTQRVGVLTRVPIVAGRKAVQVHAYNGCEHTLVVLDDGQMVSFGYNYRGQLGHGNTASEPLPKPVRGLDGIRVTQVSCSYYHSIIVCDGGEVYTFGRNDFGQLGSGDIIDRKLPCLVDALRGQKTTSLACGQYHTVVSTLEIGVQSCGKNDYGQLGLKSTEHQRNFVTVKGALEGAQVRHLRCGYYHTIVLTAGEHVFGFGRNDYGQLGLGHITQRVFGPNIVGGAEGKNVCGVSAGCYHTVLIGSDGMLYVCGRNHHGQLGTGDTNERHSPFPVSTFLGKRVAKVAAGFYHTIVLTGGANEEVLGLESGTTTVKFSPQSILSHPALVLPEESSKEESTSMATESNKVGDSRTESMTPEMTGPGCTDRGVLSASEGPTQMEDGITSKLHANSKPPGGICHRDGQVSSKKAAMVIMAHMDRLAEKISLTKGGVPVIGHVETGGTDDKARLPENGNGEENRLDSQNHLNFDRDIYVVDVSPDTFELLASILRCISEEEQFHGLGEEENFQTYMILATLRVLKANIVRLLQSHISKSIVEKMLAKPPPLYHDDAGELPYDGRLEQNPLLFSLFVDPTTKGSSTSIGRDHDSPDGDNHARTKDTSRTPPPGLRGEGGDVSSSEDVERYRNVLYTLQRRLLMLVHSESAGGEDVDGVEPVQKEAAAVLVLGLELFFPGQTEQFCLLSKLVNTTTIDEEDHREMLVGGDSDHFDHPICGPRAARHFILIPLLQRLRNDALTSKLIPYGVDVDNKGAVCSSVVVSQAALKGYTATAASARLLEMQVTMLIELIAQGNAYASSSGEPFAYGAQEGSAPSVIQLNGSATNCAESFDLGNTNASHALGEGFDNSLLTHRLLVDLVLTLTKHMLHWAASDHITVDRTLWQSRVVEGVGFDTCSTGSTRLDREVPAAETVGWFAARARVLCSCAASVVLDGMNHMPSSWRCLINYAELVLKYSTAIIEAALEKEVHDNGEEGAAAETDTAVVDRLEETLVGLLLPAVITGLLPFAHIPLFARRLVDVVSATVGLLDEMCFRCPFTRLADENYIAARNGGAETLKTKCKPQTGFMRGENGKLGMGVGGGRNGNCHGNSPATESSGGLKASQSVKDSQNLPWLLSLAKITSLLAGRMAATIIVGDSGISPFLEDYFRSSAYSFWLESDLLRGGCDPCYEDLMLAALDFTSRDDTPAIGVPVAVNTRNASPGFTVGTPSNGVGSRHEFDEFLEEMVCGNGKGCRFMTWLTDALAPSNTAYQMIKRQATTGKDGRALARVERAMMAAMLRQGGLHSDAALFSAQLERQEGGGAGGEKRNPPRRFATLWKSTSAMVGWLWHARSKLRSAEADQSRIGALFEDATNCCLVLMLFTPVGSVHPLLVPERRTPSPSRSRADSIPAVRRRWRKAMTVAWVMIRWRAMVSGRLWKDTVAAVPRFIRSMLRTCSETKGQMDLSKHEKDSPAIGDNPSVGCLLVLLVLVMDNHHRAVARASGVRSFRALAGVVRTRSLLADILLPLAPAMQTPRLVDRHILSHLEAVGGRFTLDVTTAFQSLLSELLQLLQQSSRSREGGMRETSSMTIADKGAATWGELVKASDCKISMPHWFDARSVLLLLEIWGLTIQPEDWRFIETVGVIDVISRISAVPVAVSGQEVKGAGGEKRVETAREDEVSSRKARASQRQEKLAPSDQRFRPLARCQAAAWTLFRVLIIQLDGKTSMANTVGDEPPQLDSIVEVLRTELAKHISKAKYISGAVPRELEGGGRREGGASRQHRDRTPSQAILEFANPLIGGFPTSPQHDRGTSNGRAYRTGTSHKRRCQELVCGPRRLMNMEDGLVFPAEHVLSNPRSSDFSITFWLRLTQDRTGYHRTVLARGHGSERWPVVLLRNSDNRLEVCFGIPSMGNLCERLTSKEPVQMNKWTHVGLVSEHNKIRLYFNGTLDCQRSSTGALRGNRHPLYVGKVPDGAMRLEGVRGGVEGSVANLRYFTRALSPIHVRIICDPGPPETAKVEDRHLYHLCAFLVPISRSPQCRHHFKHPKWLKIFLQAFTHGTVRVQQAACRLLREILPLVPPATMASIVLERTRLQAEMKEFPLSPAPTTGGDRVSFIMYLLRLVGVSSWYVGAVMPNADGVKAVSHGVSGEEAREMTVAEILLGKHLMKFLPPTIAPLLARRYEREAESVGVESGQEERGSHRASDATLATRYPAPSLSAETVRGINTVGAELVALVQTLAATELWAAAVSSALKQSLACLTTFVDTAGGIEAKHPTDRDDDSEGVNVEEQLAIAGGEAALHVLGGTIDVLSAGAFARIRETDQQCIVLEVDQAMSTAYVTVHPKEGSAVVDKWVHRLGTHDLEVQESDYLSRGAIIALSDSASGSLHRDGATPGHTYITGVATTLLCSTPLPRPEIASGREHVSHSNMTYREIIMAQCRSRMARALLRASRNAEWVRGAIQSSDILMKLLRVAIDPCSTTTAQITEMFLAETETVAIQERLHQMLATAGGAEIVAGKIAEMVLYPGKNTNRRSSLDSSGDRDLHGRATRGVNHHRSSASFSDRSWVDNLSCPFCHEEKTTVAGIVEHVITKHSTDMRRVSCPVCLVEKGDDTIHDLPTHLELVHFDEVLRDRRSFLPTFRERRRESGGVGRLEAQPPSHLVEQLMVIGFPEDWCTMALRENDNDVVNASAWIVDNLDMLSSLNNLSISSQDHAGGVEVGTTSGDIRRSNDRQPWRGPYRFGREGLELSETRQFGNNDHVEEGEEQEENFVEDGSGGQEVKYHDDEEEGGRGGNSEEDDDEVFDSEDEDEEEEEGEGDEDEEEEGEATGVNRGFGTHNTEHPRQITVLPPRRSALDNTLDDNRHEIDHKHRFMDGLVVPDHREIYFPLERETSWASSGTVSASTSLHSKTASVKSKVTGMELCQLTEAWLHTELELTTLYCRAAFINMLLRWPQHVPMGVDSFGSSAMVVQLIQNVVFNGEDLPISFTDERVPGNVILPAPNGARRPKVLGVFAPFLAHLLRFESSQKTSKDTLTASTGEALTDSEGEVKSFERGSRTAATGESGECWQDNLSARLVSICLDGLDAAAKPETYADIPWTAVESSSSSTRLMASGKSKLNLFQWLLDLLLSVGCVDIFTENAFSRLSNCLNNPNAAAKEVAMYALTSIATKWSEHLAVDREQGGSKASEPSPAPAGLPSPLAMEETFQRHMVISRVRSTLVKRIAVERRPGGLFFTKYTQTLTALYVAMRKLQRLLVCRRRQSGCTELTEGLNFFADVKIGTPTILYCTDSSVALTWLPLRKVGSTSNITYEVQMAATQLGTKEVQEVFRGVYNGKRLRCRVEDLMPGQVYRFRLRAVHPTTKVTGWSSIATAETEQGVAFRFDAVNSGPDILVGGNEISASFRSNETWSTILGTIPFCTGSNYWELHLDKSATSYLFIGVATRDADLTTFLGGDDNGWGFIGDRALYHKRTKVKAYGERFGQGDTIGVSLNMDRGTLSFSKNGQDLGVAFEGLVGSLYPAVAFYNQGQRLSLIQSAFRCPGAGVTILSSPLNTMPEDVMALSDVMEAMVSSRILPLAWMEVVRAGHMAWLAGTTVRYVTILGFELQFDVSDSACRRFGLRAQGRVRTPRGNATVVGTCEGVMWFHVDGEAGAWFFTAGEVWEGKSAGCFTMSEFDALGADRDSGNKRCTSPDEGCVEQHKKADESRAKIALGDVGESAASTASPGCSEEDFATVGNCAMWTPAVDGCIVAALCGHANRHQISVWNCTPADVLKVLTPVRRRLELLLACDSVSDEQLLCRVSVLKQYNHELVSVLPFADLAEGVQVSGQAETRTFCWGGSERHRGLAVGVGDHPTRGLGPLLVRLRRSIFLKTKQQTLSQVVKITTTHAKKTEDEYDYPDDLPQVTINRMKAAAGQESEDADVRLRTSVFHQLFRELHGVDTCLLRMGYTHPMDDGQQRTFKVKFEGEGVDDYGGPYREIFTQAAVELTSTVSALPAPGSVEQAAAGVTLREGDWSRESLLPFLEPTPSTVSVEGNVDRAFMVKGDVHRPSHLRTYRFLGQLMGVALRCRVAVPWRLSQLFWKGLVGEALHEADLIQVDTTAYAFVQSIRARINDSKLENAGVNTDESGPAESRTSLAESDLLEASEVFTWIPGARGTSDLRLAGGNELVERSDLSPHIREVTEARLHQGDRALFAVRDGFTSVVPAAVLPLFTWEELELQMCGRPGVDIDLLQANTEYDDDISWSDAHIQSFWRVLRSFDDCDRSQFLRFVWARSRLPCKAVDFHQKFKIHSPTGEGARDNPDSYLPKAHTCFFSINLPRYSSDEIMAKKLTYTMYNCIEMDADFRLADNEMPGWENEASARDSRGQSGGTGTPNLEDQLL